MPARSKRRVSSPAGRSFDIPVWTPALSSKVQRLASATAEQRRQDATADPRQGCPDVRRDHETMPKDVGRVKGPPEYRDAAQPEDFDPQHPRQCAALRADIPADALDLGGRSLCFGSLPASARGAASILARGSGGCPAAARFLAWLPIARDAGASKAASLEEGVKTLLTLARLGSAGNSISARSTKDRAGFSQRIRQLLEDTLGLVLGVPDRAFHQAAFRASICARCASPRPSASNPSLRPRRWSTRR